MTFDGMPTAPAPRRRGWLVWLLVLAAIIGVAVWIFQSTKPAAEAGGRGRGREMPPVPVLMGAVTRADVPLQMKAVGTIEASETVSVRAQAGGEIVEVGFSEGQPVKKGQMLFRLDAAPLEAELKRAQAQLMRDRAQLAQAESDARRYAGLAEQGFVPRQQAEQSAASAAALAGTVQADLAQIETARVQLGYATIRSPIAGVAGDRLVDRGNLVRAGDANPLVVINRLSPVFVTFAVPQQEIDRVRRYQKERPIQVTATPRGGQPRTGQLAFFDNQIDPATGTLKLKARFDNADGALVPGQFADVALTLTLERDRVTAPAQAVMPGQNGHLAFVVNADGTVTQRPVVVARSAGDRVVVTSGLTPGEKVVTDGTLQLRDGAKVEERHSLVPPSPQAGEGRKRKRE